MYSLKRKIAVVTGASRGIGRAISFSFAEAGATVALVSRSLNSLNEIQSEIVDKGGHASVHSCDVTSLDSVTGIVKDIIQQHGAIDILVNNAGITRDNLLMRMKSDDWEAPLKTNLSGAFHCIKAVSRHMIKQRNGRIINITSIVGLTGNAGQGNYAASKAGLIGLTKSAAKELAPRNITVNAVAPGYVTTDLTAGLPENIHEQLAGSIPLGRLGSPEDIAGTVLFLASDAASYITGQTLVVDGGMIM